jgi:ABC-type lipoprotein release transport system permease subunit
MAVLERTREFGIMLAVGTSWAGVCPSCTKMLLGLFGLLVGNALGIACRVFQGSGIDFSAFEAGLVPCRDSNVVFPVAVDRTV